MLRFGVLEKTFNIEDTESTEKKCKGPLLAILCGLCVLGVEGISDQ
jgi:hypothetical protein